MKKLNILISLITCLVLNGYSQEGPQNSGLELINRDAIESQMSFLASDWTEGRETGEKGAFLAADELSTIDWDIMEKIIRISYLNIWELSTTAW